ncbi:MAG: redoxin domain-containing protein [Candidatus Firestonebacteria bacterium]|nr:redoxin domain-containing protein [Candidatus Firestonebacteria bacterium]
MLKKGILTIFGIFLFLCFYDPIVFAQAFKRLNVENNAIDFSLNDLNGNKISLGDYKSKKTLAVIFWKHPSLNGPKALAHWQKVFEKYKDSHNFSVISVYCPRTPQGIAGDEMTDLQKVIVENNITFPVLLDEGLNVFSKYGVISLPSSMVVNTDGVVKYILAGFPTFGAERDISINLKRVLGIPEEKVAEKKYEPDLDAGRNYKLAIAVLQRGNIDKAIEYLSVAVQKDPKYPLPYALLGKLYTQTQKTDKAMQNYQKALELDPLDTDTLINYGFLCMDMGMKDDALLQFKNIIELAPQKSAEAYYGMGTIYLKNEVFDSAIVKVQEAIRLYQEQKKISNEELLHLAISYENLAEIHLKTDRKKDALDYYKKALEKYEKISDDLVRESKKSIRAN